MGPGQLLQSLTSCVALDTSLHCLVPQILHLKNGDIHSKPLPVDRRVGGYNIACDGLGLVHTSGNGVQIIKIVHSFLRQGLGAMLESKALGGQTRDLRCRREAP